MATHDYVIANQSGAAFRTDLNNALAAIVSNNSNSSSPATTYAYQWWADTNAGVLKIRNSANNAWVELLQLDGTLTLEDGSESAPALAFRDDLNTGIFSSAADTFNVATAGGKRLTVDSVGRVLINSDTEGHADADDLTIESSSGYAGITLRAGTSDGGALYFSDATSGAGEYVGQVLYSHNTNKLSLVASGSQQLDLSDGVARFHGKLLAGTDTEGHPDADDLTLESSSGYTGITLRAGTTQGGAIYFSDATSGAGEYDGQILYSHNSQKMFIAAGGLTGFEVHSTKDCEVTDGNLVIGTAGHGIDFSQTGQGGGSVGSELLADYEIGTWTPAYQDGTSLTVNSATYVKIGHLVMVQAYIITGTNTSSNGHVITGLPYASRNGNNFFIGSMYMQTGGTVTDHKFVQVSTNSTVMQVLKNAGSIVSLSSGSGGYVLFTVTYRAADGGS